MGELADALTHEWGALSQKYMYLKKLVESLPRRIAAVIQARGGYTLY